MSFTEEQFERIVAEVIRRLKGGSPAPVAEAAGRELALADRVITLRSVEGKLAGVSRVKVAARAVVTPAVKDELKQRQIALVRQG
jgi:hypothetical protein